MQLSKIDRMKIWTDDAILQTANPNKIGIVYFFRRITLRKSFLFQICEIENNNKSKRQWDKTTW